MHKIVVHFTTVVPTIRREWERQAQMDSSYKTAVFTTATNVETTNNSTTNATKQNQTNHRYHNPNNNTPTITTPPPQPPPTPTLFAATGGPINTVHMQAA
jgi:hypothetical protein